MNNMGQTSTEQWVPPWSQIKVYDSKDSVGMEYTMLESYFDSMYPMKSDDVSSKQSVTDGKITPDNPLHCKSVRVSSEKTGFEAEVPVTPPEDNNTCSPHVTLETVSKDSSNEKSTDNGLYCPQAVSFSTSVTECVIKEEPVIVLDDVQ
jgi:hypothetical protein